MKEDLKIYKNILHVYIGGILEIRSISTQNAMSPPHFFARIFKVVKWIAFDVFQLIISSFYNRKNIEIMNEKTILFVGSKNNIDSLNFLYRSDLDCVYVHSNKLIKGSKYVFLNVYGKIFYFHKFLFFILKNYAEHKKTIYRYFDVLFYSFGYYEFYKKQLIKNRPKAVIFANDHNFDSRSFLMAAKSLNIPTIYIQHASVTKYFPPLEFDLSLLEGEDSEKKYKAIGNVEGKIELIGMPKFDSHSNKKNLNTKITNVGICISLNDNYDRVITIIEVLAKINKYVFTLRPHPGDNIDYMSIAKKYSFKFSDSKKEGVFDFISKQDAIIASDSSIHLEAIMANVLSLYYTMGTSKELEDYYGYVDQGMIEKVELDTVGNKLNIDKPLDYYKKAKFYNASLDTEFEGKSSQKAINRIEEFINSYHQSITNLKKSN